LKPLVSIITPSYNQARFIEATINSVLSQNYPHIEYLIIDGGSTDGTIDILHRYDGRLRWMSEPDSGQSEAVNKGLRMAQGEVVAWLNSDDTYLPGAVARAVDYLENHPEVMMVYGEGYEMDELGHIRQRFPATEPFNLWRLVYYSDYILQQTTFIRREVFGEIGMLDESLHYGMDWDLFIRIGKRFKVAYIPEYLANLREHSTAKSSTGGLNRFEELARIMRHHGRRRFPPAYLKYGWVPYQQAILQKIQQHLPWLDWSWLSQVGHFLRRSFAYVMFHQIIRLSQPSPSADGWLSECTYLLVPNWDKKSLLRIIGNSSQVPLGTLPLKLKVEVNGNPLAPQTVERAEPFIRDFNLPTSCQESSMLEVILRTDKFFVKPRRGPSDQRRLTFRLKEITLV
jgi:glycosyltransferase involved in cell wall biosynthesis